MYDFWHKSSIPEACICCVPGVIRASYTRGTEGFSFCLLNVHSHLRRLRIILSDTRIDATPLETFYMLPYALFEHLAHRANEPIIEVCSVVAFQVPFILSLWYNMQKSLSRMWDPMLSVELLPTGRGIL